MPSDTPMPNLLAACTDLLASRLRACHAGEEVVAAVDWPAGWTTPEQVINLACHQAAVDLAASSGSASLGEEHQTAAFMGHLATNLAWFSVAAIASEDTADQSGLVPQVSWAYQSGPDEAVFGADFGLIRHLGGPADRIRLVLFQAKIPEMQARGWQVAIDRSTTVTGGVTKKPDLLANRRSILQGLLEATSRHPASHPDNPPIRGLEAQAAALRDVSHFQLEALMLTNLEGCRAAGSNEQPWCHYVLWFPGTAGQITLPTAMSVEEVSKLILPHLSKRAHFPRVVAAAGSEDFAGLLSRALTGGGEDGAGPGIVIGIGELEPLVKKTCALLPSLRLLLASETGDGMMTLRNALGKGWEHPPGGLQAVAEADLPRFEPVPPAPEPKF